MSSGAINPSGREIFGSEINPHLDQKKATLKGFNHRITTLCKKNFWKDAPSVIEQIKMCGLKPDAFSYTPIISMFSRIGRISNAIFYYDQMISDDVTPSLLSFNITLKGIVENRKRFWKIDDFVAKMANVLDDMIRLRVQPDVNTFSTIINGLVEVGQVNCTMDYFNLMLKMEVTPNIYVFNIMIKGFARANLFDEAFQLLNRMEVEFNIDRDEFTYSSLIPQLVSANRFNDAFALVEKMKREEIELNSYVYTALIKAHVLLGEIDKALNLFQEMKDKQIDPDKFVYTNLMQGLKSVGRSEEGKALFSEMLERRIQPDRISYRALKNRRPSVIHKW